MRSCRPLAREPKARGLAFPQDFGRPRVLLTTAYRHKPRWLQGDVYDYGKTYVPRLLRPAMPRLHSYGLRFIKQNVPEVKILEYPTRGEYLDTLDRGWDIVGISFYIDEIHEAREMARLAREAGAEAWGGNYGALTPGLEEDFDRLVLGYGEAAVAEAVGHPLGRIRHPLLPRWVGLPHLKLLPVGTLFTQRSCAFRCNFCQTPALGGKPSTIPLESIEEVLQAYRKMGIHHATIGDEFFGMFVGYSRQVIDLLVELGFTWSCQTRPDLLLRHLDEWMETGLVGANIGVESLNPDALACWNKRYTASETCDLIRRLHEADRSVVGYYIIGHENHTAPVIKEEIRRLADLRLDIAQVCILTPLPRTGQWDHITSTYGIFETDWHRWDLHHLVWNHPRIAAGEMRRLLGWSLRTANPPGGVVRTARKMSRCHRALRRKSHPASALGDFWRAHRVDYFNSWLPVAEPLPAGVARRPSSGGPRGERG